MQEAKTGCSGGRVLTSVLGFSVSQRMLRKTEALMKNLISIVVPCFNEQEVLRQTYGRYTRLRQGAGVCERRQQR